MKLRSRQAPAGCHTVGMKPLLPLVFLLAAAPAWAQLPAAVDQQLLRATKPGVDEDAAPTGPPPNLRPTQLLRCPDGKGGVALQDTPCKPATEAPGAAPASEVTDLSQLAPRAQAQAVATRVEPAGPSRWTGMLYGAGRLAVLLALLYAVYRIGRYARDRFRQRFGASEMPARAPHRIR